MTAAREQLEAALIAVAGKVEKDVIASADAGPARRSDSPNEPLAAESNRAFLIARVPGILLAYGVTCNPAGVKKEVPDLAFRKREGAARGLS